MPTAPLASIRVAVHAHGVAAAQAGRLLATLGAECLLVEPPEGSALRRAAPFLPSPSAEGLGVGLVGQGRTVAKGPTPTPPLNGRGLTSAIFAYLTAGMTSAVYDLTDPEQRAGFGAVLAQTDIFIDDTAMHDRPALGLDEATIASQHPHLIHVSTLPFGASGPKSGWKGGELQALHASGEGYLLPNGLTTERFPNRPPVKVHGHFTEMQGGVAAALGALAALWVRDEIGGQYVDVSAQDAGLAVGAFAIQRLGDGSVEHRVERSFRYGGVIECADGFVELLTLEQRQWAGLVELLGSPLWAQDPALADSVERSRRGPEINRHIRSWAARRKVDDVVREGQILSVPLAKYYTPAEVLADPHEAHRGLFQNVEVPGIGALPMLVSPFHFDGAPLVLAGGPPA